MAVESRIFRRYSRNFYGIFLYSKSKWRGCNVHRRNLSVLPTVTADYETSNSYQTRYHASWRMPSHLENLASQFSTLLTPKRRTKGGEEDKALGAANNEADMKARGEMLMTGG